MESEEEDDTEKTDQSEKSSQMNIDSAAEPPEDTGTPEEYAALSRFLKYYSDGIRFCKQIKNAVPTLCELMTSNTKTEVVEAMKFFVTAYKLDIEGAKVSRTYPVKRTSTKKKKGWCS
jgi:condensin complex subunit 1